MDIKQEDLESLGFDINTNDKIATRMIDGSHILIVVTLDKTPYLSFDGMETKLNLKNKEDLIMQLKFLENAKLMPPF